MQAITLPAGRSDSARAAAFIQSLPVDKAWRVVVEPWKARRSEQQNRYLWGIVYPAVLEGGGESLRGWTAEDLHEFFLGEHFGWEVVEGFGKRRQRPIRRSARLSKTEFSEYVAAIQVKAAQLGIYIPDPEERL
jgi:hypothetical protein